MTTEREYKELHERIRKLRQRKSRKKILFLITLCCLAGLLTSTYKNWSSINYSYPLISWQKAFQSPKDSFLIKPTSTGDISSIKTTDFNYIDSVASHLNYQGKSTRELAKLLSQYATTDLDKARIIYSWIAYHIDYDVENFLQGTIKSVTSEEVLKSRKAVCDGYSKLYKDLATKMGLSAIVIEGYAKGYGYNYLAQDRLNQTNHAWNAVKINQSWYLIDSTWGAGFIQDNKFIRKFDNFYFAPAPEALIFSHFPDNSEWQLIERKYTGEDFLNFPKFSPDFFELELKLISPFQNNIATDNHTQIIIAAPKDIVATAQLVLNNQELDTKYLQINRNNNLLIIDADFPVEGNYQLNIFAKKNQQEGSYPHIMTYFFTSQ